MLARDMDLENKQECDQCRHHESYHNFHRKMGYQPIEVSVREKKKKRFSETLNIPLAPMERAHCITG